MPTTINVSWDQVTSRADGSALTTPIDKYEINYYLGSAPLSGMQPPVFVPANQTTAVIENVPNGQMGVRVRAIDVNGNVGAWTQYAAGDTSAIPPGTPGNFTATFTKS